MGGKGELVSYIREYRMSPVSHAAKQKLIQDVTAAINRASKDITVILLVQASPQELKDELEAPEKDYDPGKAR